MYYSLVYLERARLLEVLCTSSGSDEPLVRRLLPQPLHSFGGDHDGQHGVVRPRLKEGVLEGEVRVLLQLTEITDVPVEELGPLAGRLHYRQTSKVGAAIAAF